MRQGAHWRVGASLLAFAWASGIGGMGRAAELPLGPPPAISVEELGSMGVPCDVGAPFWEPPLPTAADLPWPSVWLGHFSGGRPYVDGYGVTLVDWRDEKLCFSSRRACQTWIAVMRRAFHHPEGYWTCLVLR